LFYANEFTEFKGIMNLFANGRYNSLMIIFIDKKFEDGYQMSITMKKIRLIKDIESGCPKRNQDFFFPWWYWGLNSGP
jgi:hypothetical protein